jgi:DNA-binding MarR family transcriptional regulator
MTETIMEVPEDVLGRSDLSYSDKLVLWLLIRRSNGRGDCRVSLKSMTKDLVLPKGIIQRALQSLEQAGLIVKQQMPKGVRYTLRVNQSSP